MGVIDPSGGAVLYTAEGIEKYFVVEWEGQLWKVPRSADSWQRKRRYKGDHKLTLVTEPAKIRTFKYLHGIP